MRLLVLNYELPPIGGGGGIIAYNLAQQWAAQGHKVSIISVWFKGLSEYELKGNLEIFRVKSKRKNEYASNPIEMLDWGKKAKELYTTHLSSRSFDLCVAHFVLPGGSVAKHILQKSGTPYIVISHGHDVPWVHAKRMFILYAAAYFRIKNVLKNSLANFVQTSEMQNNIDAFLGKKYRAKNHRISNGCDTTMFAPQQEKNKIFSLIFCGRLVKQKNPELLLKALHICKQQQMPFSCSIYGNGYLMNKLKRDSEAFKLQEHINFKGKVSQQVLAKAYSESHVLVVCSQNEGMSISMIEAACSGMYILSTPVSGHKEIVKENGKIYPFNDAEALANCIYEAYIKHNKGENLVDDTFLQTYRQVFDWEGISKEYISTFEKLLAQ